jgi:hypothetical protein
LLVAESPAFGAVGPGVMRTPASTNHPPKVCPRVSPKIPPGVTPPAAPPPLPPPLVRSSPAKYGRWDRRQARQTRGSLVGNPRAPCGGRFVTDGQGLGGRPAVPAFRHSDAEPASRWAYTLLWP